MSEKHLADMLNPGEKSAQMLHAAGIHTVKQLAPGAIEGALTNTHWNKLDRATREALLMAVDARVDEQ